MKKDKPKLVYLIVRIDENLKERLKIYCARKRKTIRSVIASHINEIAKEE